MENSQDHFNYIPKDILVFMSLNLDIYEVLGLCKTNKIINDKICNNKYFWLKKLAKDFNFIYDDYITDEDPKLAYKLLYKIDNTDYNMHLNVINQPAYQAAKTGSKSLFRLVLKKIQHKFPGNYYTKQELYNRSIRYGLEGSIESQNLVLIKFFVEGMREKVLSSHLKRAIELNNVEITKYLQKHKVADEYDNSLIRVKEILNGL